MPPLRFQVAMRRRLRWPLPLAGGFCCKSHKCGRLLNALGDRAAACPYSGRLKTRSVPVERAWKRILREAGARVRDNVLLVDSAIAAIDPGDGRRVEIVATGLPYCQGVPLAVDATMVSPLHADGTAFPGAAEQPGVAFERAWRAKHTTYPELVASHQLRLVVAAVEWKRAAVSTRSLSHSWNKQRRPKRGKRPSGCNLRWRGSGHPVDLHVVSGYPDCFGGDVGERRDQAPGCS